MQKKCYFGCKLRRPLHSFPSPVYPHEERFDKWKSVLSKELKSKSNSFIRGNVRLCDRHFEQMYKTRGNRLTANSIPTLYLSPDTEGEDPVLSQPIFAIASTSSSSIEQAPMPVSASSPLLQDTTTTSAQAQSTCDFLADKAIKIIGKKHKGNNIVRKWSNMRDSYMKSLRNKPRQGFRKKYMYAENMTFLMKNVTEKENDVFNLSDNESSQSVAVSFIQQSLSDETPTTTPEPFLEFPATEFVNNEGVNSNGSSRQKKKRKEPNGIKKSLLEESQKKSRNDTSASPAEKETMLLSFLPYIKDMNEMEMMDFHIEMLTSIRKIKSKRAQSPAACTSSPTESRTPDTANSPQLPLTPTIKESPQTKPTPKPPIIKLDPKKTLNFTFPKSRAQLLSI